MTAPKWEAMLERNFRQFVGVRLRQGFGVEDIAIKAKVPVDKVRAEIQRRRESGDLARIYGVKHGSVVQCPVCGFWHVTDLCPQCEKARQNA